MEKLLLVYHLGSAMCWQLRVAKNAEEALMQCFKAEKFEAGIDPQHNCRVEEVEIPGYEITVRRV